MKVDEWRRKFYNECIASDCNEAIAVALKNGWIMDGINNSRMDDYWREYEAKRDITGVVFGAVAGSIILILLLIVLLPWLRNYLCPGLTFGYCIHKTKEVNVERAFDEELLLDDEKITVLKEIASGSFGTIYKGTFLRSNGAHYSIALKTIRVDVEKGREKDRDRLELLKKEGVKMKNFNHPHVLSLKGIAYIKDHFCLVFKWMDNGALNQYVKKNRNLSKHQLLSFCADIADGMTYLASHNVFHRDLAARNCLLDANLSVKVSDFGLSRGKDDSHGHFSSRHSILRNVPLPLKWMSPESIEHSFFDERTDVWSFGITIWEIFNFGSIPWNKVPTDQQRFIAHLKKGNKPKKTQSIPDDMYDIMKICLELNKWERKTFSELLVIFNTKLEEIEKAEKTNSKLLPRRTSRAGTWKIPESFVKYRQDTVDLFNDRSVSIVTNESEIPPPYSESVRRSSSRRSTPSRTTSPLPPSQTAPSGGGEAKESDKLLTHSTTQYV